MDTTVQVTGEAPVLSLNERDRRYAAVRAQLAERGLDAVIVTGSHLLYLSNGIPGEMFGVLPTREDEDFTAVLTWRYLADIPVQVVLDMQGWVTDIRSGRNIGPVAERLKELKLDGSTVGFAGPLGQTACNLLARDLPSMKLVEVSEALVNTRTVKSDEEIALIDRANHIFDAAVRRIHEVARPGMLGREVVQEGIKAMWEAGGDIDGYIKMNFGPVAAQNPILAEISQNRRIEEGDIGTITAHAHFQHYAGHSDQEFAFGRVNPLHKEMFDAVLKVRLDVLKHVRAGATHRELVDAYEVSAKNTGFRTSPHSQMHLYGIDVPEFPGPAYKIEDPKGGKGLGGSGNFTLESGMIYSISPTLVSDATGDSVLGGTSLVVTDSGYRDLGKRDVELLVTS